MTSHTDDSHRTQSEFDVVPAKSHKPGTLKTLYKRVPDNFKKMPAYKFVETGKIPEVEKTFGYINTAYLCINTEQLAIGVSTFGGRTELCF